MSATALKPKSNIRQARKGMYQNLLIHAAEEVFANVGYNAAKVQDIAVKAGLSLGTFYTVFDGKDDLFNAIHEQRGHELADTARSGVDPNRSAVENLLIGISKYVAYFAKHVNYLRMHLNEGAAWALETGLETPAQMLVWQEGLDLMATIVEQAIKDGDLIAEDPQVLARIISASHQVHLATWLENAGRSDTDTLIHNIIIFMKNAYLTPQGRDKTINITNHQQQRANL